MLQTMAAKSYFQRKFFQAKANRSEGQNASPDNSFQSAGSIDHHQPDHEMASTTSFSEINTTKLDPLLGEKRQQHEAEPSGSIRELSSRESSEFMDSTKQKNGQIAGAASCDHWPTHQAEPQTYPKVVMPVRQEEATAVTRANELADDSTPPDHQETAALHQQAREEGEETAIAQEARAGGAKSRESKLLKATKAILMFRRATASLSSWQQQQQHQQQHDGSSAGSSQSQRGLSYSRSLVASFWRQNTADNSTCTRSARLSSFASGSWHAGEQQEAQQAAACHHATTSKLPQFIVPRMNALKLPIVCLVRSLDGELMREIFIHRYELGQYLIDNLKVSLGMKDAKYFGLKMANSIEDQEDVRQPWLELSESVYKQIGKHCKSISVRGAGHSVASDQQQQHASACSTKSVDFYLRLKFYPPNLARVQDQFLRHYLWLQLKRDLRLGKLTSSMNNLTFLMACVLQHELGDFRQELVNEQLAKMNVLPNQDLIEQEAIEIWRRRLAGATKHQVQLQFLRASVILETYGFDYYPVRDHQRQRAYLLGFNYAGVKTIRNGRIVHHFRWNNLSKITHERRMIIFHIYGGDKSNRKQILGFKCLSNEECLNLYMRLQEQKYFFTVDLTYFDKSIRRPSHLGESALEQEQLANEATGPMAGDRPRAAVQHAPDGQRESVVAPAHEPPVWQACNCAACRRSTQMQRQTSSHDQSLESAISSCRLDSVSAASSLQPAHQLPRRHLIKSASLEEPGEGCGARSAAGEYSALDHPDRQAQPLADHNRSYAGGSAHQNHSLEQVGPAGRAASEPPDALQVQRPLVTCSPEFEMINELGDQQTRPGSRGTPLGARLAHWTEQVLTQPARVFSCADGPRAGGQPGAGARTAASGARPSGEGADASLLMQGLRFWLMIVMLNIVLRLSDSLSEVLEHLLTFRPAEQQDATRSLKSGSDACSPRAPATAPAAGFCG